VIRAVIVCSPLILLAATGRCAPENKPFVYDLITHLDDAEEFHSPALSLCKVEELSNWTGPQEIPQKGCFRYSTTVFFPRNPIRRKVGLWQGGQEIPLCNTVDDASSFPFWTFNHNKEWLLLLDEALTTNECRSMTVDPLSGTAEVEIYARGAPADGKWPVMWAILGSKQRHQQVVDSSVGQFYRFLFRFPGVESNLRVCLVNDIQTPTWGDRSIVLNWVKVIPPSTIDLYVESPAGSTTAGITFRSLPVHLSLALADDASSLLPLRPEIELNRRSAVETEIGVNGETREALFLPGPSRIAYSMCIPSDATLEFAVTVAHGYAGPPKWGHGTVRWLWERKPGDRTVLFERFFNPQYLREERRWIPFEIGLQAYAGDEGLLVLETENGFPSQARFGATFVDDRFQGIQVAHPRVYSVPTRAQRQSFSRPDVIIISIDTLRADHVGCYGYHRNTTPRLDRLAAEGVVFEAAYSTTSWTLPSHVSLFTSVYPPTHEVTAHGTRISEKYTQLGEWFRERDCRSGGFTDGAWLRHVFGYARGFDVYQDRNVGIAEILPRALEWWEKQPRGFPRMMFIHFYDVHGPYGNAEKYQRRFHPLPEYNRFPYVVDAGIEFKEKFDRGEFILIEDDIEHFVALYDGDIYYSDEKLGELFDRLKERDEWDSTLIVVLSDHGEEFLEHGGLLHGYNLYEESLHIPLIIKFPGGKWPGTRVDGLASLIDILPTLADWMNEDQPPEWQGESLIPLISDSKGTREAVYADRLREFKQITSDFRLIVPTDPLDSERKPELYDGRFDPGEQFSLFDQAGEWAKEKAASVYRVRADFRGDSIGAEETQLTDSELEEQLKALGYAR
jgi:arylsulfatase A-like enzyme